MPTGPIRIAAIPAPVIVRTLPIAVTGRVAMVHRADGGTDYRRQWPGTYFETAFRGAGVAFRVGPGDVVLRIGVDGAPATALVKPRPGFYAIEGLGRGPHRIRIDVASESQAGPTVFGGFYAMRGTTALPVRPRARQMEFIGDSHTVGYGNRSASRTCTPDQIWATTDTAAGVAAQAAARYGADYRVNAISGRGIVRNYAGIPGDTVPEAYPHVLFDGTMQARDPAWRPRVIAIALGTNDFTSPLHTGERWATRDALHADFEATYVRFVRMLRARDPQAFVVIWATDMADGEIESEARRVVDRLRAAGERRIAFVPVHALGFGGCDSHPTVADDGVIAAAIDAAIDAQPDVWGAAPPGTTQR